MIFEALFDFQVKRFYKENPTEYLSDKAGEIPDACYYGVKDHTGNIIAATSCIHLTDNLVMMQSTMVTPEYRGQGVGKFLNNKLEENLKSKGYGKIVSHIYVENLPSIILKLKLGYLIEGTLHDHDFKGQHEYVLGKQI